MAENEARQKELKTSRRNKKSFMTRNLNQLTALLDDPEAEVESVAELMQTCEDAFKDVELVHQALCETLDDDAFEAEEDWIQKCQEAFWKARNLGRKFLTKKGVNKSDVSSSSGSTNANNVNAMTNFSDLRLALELPKAHVEEFNGDPASYWTFVNNFKTNIASKLSDDNTRLQYLLQLCKGKAHMCIESCALLEQGGYHTALDILRKQFGQPHMILSRLMGELLDRKRISTGDGDGLWALVSSMKKCQVTLTQMGYINDLNSTSNLLKIQMLLPIGIQNAWADKAHDLLQNGEPTFLDMLNFLEKKAEVSCNMFGRSVGKNGVVSSISTSERPKIKVNNIKTKRKLQCFYCNDEHVLNSCTKFLDMSYDERLKVVKEKKLCFRCLVVGHAAHRCRKDHLKCGKCNSPKHHELLHPTDPSPVVTSRAAMSGKSVYLMVVPVKVRASNGNEVTTLALLDNGSDSSLCSDSLRRKLGVAGQRVTYTSVTINGEEMKDGRAFELKVKGMDCKGLEERELSTKVLTVDAIPSGNDAIPTRSELKTWDHLSDLPLPDTNNLKVDLLIGADNPEAFWVIDERRNGPKDPYAIQTPLGWCVMGPGRETKTRSICHRITITNEQILDQLKKTWTIDNEVDVDADSVQDKKAKQIMTSTISQTETNNYQMGLLWKDNRHNLPCNKPLAKLRLTCLERKLNKDEVLKEKYVETVESYISKGYAEPAEDTAKEGNEWYLPHHPVLNPHKPGKVRVVFDCAAKWQNTSLNQQLLKGPDVISNLVGVLLRFRQEKIALVSDIEAMFHQVKVIPSDRDVLRFLWWKDGKPSNPVKEYRMAVHLFGATSSPSCAGYALKKTADDNEHSNTDLVGKRAIDAIRHSFYVDDCLTSTSDTESAVNLAERLRTILAKGGFRLTKWISNAREVLNSIPESERAPSVSLNLDELPTERTLGVSWDAEHDVFKFQVDLSSKPLTRRGLLSVTSSIYDPLGFAAPFVLYAKSILQTVCRKGSDWDEMLDKSEVKVWKEWLASVPNLVNVQVPRWMKLEQAVQTTLHIFCDASERGYAACAYSRTISADDKIDVSFVMGKAKVTPLKKISIPRLELLAAVLAVKLEGIIKREISDRFKFDTTVFWSDSMIVLGYIANESKRFKTFVANRVTHIRESSHPNQWRHVPTEVNPADEGSRGTLLLGKWISGPDFLLKDQAEWPIDKHAETKSDDPEVKVNVLTNALTIHVRRNEVLEELSSKLSSWSKLIRVYGYVSRFIARTRKTASKHMTTLTVAEVKSSENQIIEWMQRSEFKKWKTDQRLKKLKPVLMSNLLRVGGRIDQARVDEVVRHPVILPAYTNTTNLIIRHFHEAVGHSGWMATLNALRQKFWLLKGRNAVKSALSGCVICKKYSSRPAQQLMADLPLERLDSDKPPFTNVGVDFFGPFNVKQGRSMVKRYGCIFTCLVSRAVHLELAGSLETDSFINALRRFVARRGQPEKFLSDNGTNFHGAERELRQAVKKMKTEQIENFCHTKGFEWKFNPASASHFGGSWERLIKSVRRIMNGVLRQQAVNEEMLTTVLAEVESILNSRPLTDMSQDPRDEEPITPNHLLLLRNGPDAPTTVGLDKSVSYGRKRWLQVQYLASLFWTRWRKEYLPLLQKRHKWTTPKDNVMVDDLVLLVDETTPRGRWPMGRVLFVRKSSDGKVRSVDVKVNNNILSRPITKLCIVYRETVANAASV